MSPIERIDKLLNERGMSRRQLAILAKIPPSSFQAAMSRGKNMTVEMLQAVAYALNVSASYLLGQSDSPVTSDVRSVFLNRLLLELENSDQDDLCDSGTSSDSFRDVLDSKAPITLERMNQIASSLGVTMDYLTGRTDDHHTTLLGVKDSDLEDQIDDAEEELLRTVRDICGMDVYHIAECYAIGKLHEVWNPEKIMIIREYLQDSRSILQKMFDAKLSSFSKQDKAASGAANTESGENDKGQ